MTEIIEQVRAVRPFWSPVAIADTARQCADQGRGYTATLNALLAVADDPYSINPGRVLSDGPWWRPAAERRQRSTTDERVEATLALADRLDGAQPGRRALTTGGAR